MKMRIASVLLVIASAMAANREWVEAHVASVEYENTNPVGPPGNKAVKYTLTLPDASIVTAYHVSPTVFSNFRKDIAEAGKSVKVAVKKTNIYLIDSNGKEHRLQIHNMSKRPARKASK